MGMPVLRIGLVWGALKVLGFVVDKVVEETSPGVTEVSFVDYAELECRCGCKVKKPVKSWRGYKGWGWDCGCGEGEKYRHRVTVTLTMPVDLRMRLMGMEGKFGSVVEELCREALAERDVKAAEFKLE